MPSSRSECTVIPGVTMAGTGDRSSPGLSMASVSNCDEPLWNSPKVTSGSFHALKSLPETSASDLEQ